MSRHALPPSSLRPPLAGILCALASILLGSGARGQVCDGGEVSTTLDFDGMNGQSDFSISGSNWSGGIVATAFDPTLYASGAFAYLPLDGSAEVTFDQPLLRAELFFVHADGEPTGTATAWDADDNELASVASQLATFFADPANFVTLDPETGIARITFTAGHIDDFTFVAPAPVVQPIVLGDAVDGTFAASVHTLLFEAVAGTKINMKARRLKGSDVSPTIRILDPDDEEVLASADSVVSQKAARVKKLELTKTGLYTAEIGATAGQGAYRLTTGRRYPKVPKQVVAVAPPPPPGAEPEPDAILLLDAVAGTLIKKLTVKRIKPKGDFALIDGQPADLMPIIESITFLGEGVDPPAFEPEVNAAMTRVTVRDIELPTGGTWQVVVGGDGTVGFGRAAVKLVHPKSKQVLCVGGP